MTTMTYNMTHAKQVSAKDKLHSAGEFRIKIKILRQFK